MYMYRRKVLNNNKKIQLIKMHQQFYMSIDETGQYKKEKSGMHVYKFV